MYVSRISLSSRLRINKRKVISYIMSRRLSRYALFVALAFIFSYVEALLPLNIGIPGVKPGFANIVILLAIFSEKYNTNPYIICILRVVLTALTFGNMTIMIYSLAGGLLSSTAMLISHRINRLSIIGVSVLGGISHNIGQLIVAALLLSTSGLLYYLPLLLIAGVITGFITGVIANECLKRIRYL